ncbi:MAG TPA: hypothetical protein PKJ56_06150 [Promineifilum sp.]|nr:hypothetical protein [Promineifilum sp.]
MSPGTVNQRELSHGPNTNPSAPKVINQKMGVMERGQARGRPAQTA